MERNRGDGQYGKRNPHFMYQATQGYSVTTELKAGRKDDNIIEADNVKPPYSGAIRCGVI